MTKYAKKESFQKVTANKGSKSFWNAIKTFFTNRGIITNDNITLEENGVLKNDREETTEVFDRYYINIVETTSEKQPSSVGNPKSQDRATGKVTIGSYKNHPSVVTSLPPAFKEEIYKIVK